VTHRALAGIFADMEFRRALMMGGALALLGCSAEPSSPDAILGAVDDMLASPGGALDATKARTIADFSRHARQTVGFTEHVLNLAAAEGANACKPAGDVGTFDLSCQEGGSGSFDYEVTRVDEGYTVTATLTAACFPGADGTEPLDGCADGIGAFSRLEIDGVITLATGFAGDFTLDGLDRHEFVGRRLELRPIQGTDSYESHELDVFTHDGESFVFESLDDGSIRVTGADATFLCPSKGECAKE
jgi:hypothetical protein